jgi:ubiquitin-protein ligase
MFDIPMPSASATAVLRVQLPPLFPDHPPALRLMGLNIRHQWVDPGGLVAYHPRLNPWHPQNSLAEIVVQVCVCRDVCVWIFVCVCVC